MPAREDIEFTSGGETCAAWLYRPEGAGDPVPCVVMAHGFSATRADRLPAYVERFAAAGFATLLFDYRHFGDSGGEPRQLLDISRQLDDYRAAIAFAKALPGVGPARIALFGSSFSGGHVVTLAAEDATIAAVVAQAPFADGLPTVVAVGARNALRGTALGIADQLGALAGRPPQTMPAVGPPGSFAAMTAPEAKPGFAAVTGADSRWRNEVAARCSSPSATRTRPPRPRPPPRWPRRHPTASSCATRSATSTSTLARTSSVRSPTRSHFLTRVLG